MNRRCFLGRAATTGAAGFLILRNPRSVRGAPANDRPRLALIGVGGRGSWFVQTLPDIGTEVAALCDVDDRKAADGYKKIPGARKYHDFRELLHTEADRLDGVVIAAPDHIHAPAASLAMRLGKPVFCEKPLTHTLAEARKLRQMARERNLATQMGNQGTSSEAFRKALECVEAGYIGEVREAFGWNNGGGAGRRPAPAGPAQPIPDTLQWNLWLGPAAERAYHPDWLRWHTWRDFATGQLGNWAVHSLNLAFKAFRLDELWLDAPPAESKPADRTVHIQSEVSERHGMTFPRWEQITWQFPARGKLPPAGITWLNGRGADSRARVEEILGQKLEWTPANSKKWVEHAGLLLIGTEGHLITTGHNMTFTLMPEERFGKRPMPSARYERSRGHERDWLRAIQGGPAGWSNFDYGGPLTEFIHLGNIATQVEGPLRFDPAAMKFSNRPDADALLTNTHRAGWEV